MWLSIYPSCKWNFICTRFDITDNDRQWQRGIGQWQWALSLRKPNILWELIRPLSHSLPVILFSNLSDGMDGQDCCECWPLVGILRGSHHWASSLSSHIHAMVSIFVLCLYLYIRERISKKLLSGITRIKGGGGGGSPSPNFSYFFF